MRMRNEILIVITVINVIVFAYHAINIASNLQQRPEKIGLQFVVSCYQENEFLAKAGFTMVINSTVEEYSFGLPVNSMLADIQQQVRKQFDDTSIRCNYENLNVFINADSENEPQGVSIGEDSGARRKVEQL